MVELYLIRHAEAMGNVKEFFQGSLDVEISSKGLKQLEELKSRFKDVSLDAIYSSPLKRAMQTAQAINEYHGLNIGIVDNIKEINGGDFEGKTWKDIPKEYPQQYECWVKNQIDFKAPNGETMQDVYDRMVSAMNGIVTDSLNLNRNISIAVVSHGCAIKNYQCYLNHADISYMSKIGWADNTSVSKVEFKTLSDWKVIYLNDSSHLSQENSTIRYSSWCKA